MIDFINKVLVNHSGECFENTCSQSFWSFISDFDRVLQQTKREFINRFTSDPEPKIFMNSLLFIRM